MVYYRKYRPQTVAELDLEDVRGKLESILRAKEIPHAFLFTGPKGLGKTSAARILAKAINCETRGKGKGERVKKEKKGENKLNPSPLTLNPGIEPCNKCDACVSITNGSNIDVLEIDAASNRGIDEIRDLREKIKYAPSNLLKKIYIIDEVHMLTADAFNALLKTLEEPPAHAVFILCTTEAEKVPGTIASRTFHVLFKKPTHEEILHSLSRIVRGEKIDIDKEVLDQIFKFSEGSFRDAAKILEELVIESAGKKITLEIFSKIYKTIGLEADVKRLFAALSKKDSEAALAIIDELSQKGIDFKFLTERIAQTLHDMLLSGNSEFQTGELTKLLELVNNSYRDIKFSVLPQIPLELAIVEWCLNQKTEDREETEIKGQKTEDITKKIDKTLSPVINDQPLAISHQSSGGMFSTSAKSDNFMAALLASIKRDNHSIAGILRGCSLIDIAGNIVQFETKYKFHRDRLSDPKVRDILDQRASQILKEKVHVVVNLVEK